MISTRTAQQQRRKRHIVLTLALLALAGCGPRESGGAAVVEMVGSYTGTWAWSGTNRSGTLLLIIDPAGNLSGTLNDASYPAPGRIVGEMHDGGQTAMYGVFDVTRFDYPFVEHFEGRFFLREGSRLAGTLFRLQTEPLQRVHFELTRTPVGFEP
jgi:hypothetical protein